MTTSERTTLGELSAAVYYPHTTIRSEALLKTALLLWDQVDCIVPNARFNDSRKRSRSVQKAIDIIVRNQPVSESIKESVHGRLEKILQNGLPEWLTRGIPQGWRGDRRYLIFPEKLAHETWRLLCDVKALDWDKGSRDYAVPPMLGLLLMAILADEVAGKTRRRVTDRIAAYSWLSGVATEEMGGRYLPEMDASHLSSTYDRLATIAVDVLDASKVPMTRLVALREREAREGSVDLAALRRNFLTRVDNYVATIATAEVSVRDQEELRWQFRRAMQADLKVLKAELGMAKKEVILSTEVGVTILAVAGAALAPAVASAGFLATMKTVGIGAVLRSGSKYKNARRKAYNNSALSWLYLAKHRWE